MDIRDQIEAIVAGGNADKKSSYQIADEVIEMLQGEGILNVDGECEVCGDEIPLDASEENDFSNKCEACRELHEI